jgi:peptidoglycan/LPS O-acetylase OafA/YrhL
MPDVVAIPRTDRPAHDRDSAHIPALDGIRGLAILLVLLYHSLLIAGNSPLVRLIQKTWGFGWVGVDLFFVLSGFLITGILLDAKCASAGGYFRNFYARRTVRIFPLYFAFLALFLVILPRVLAGFDRMFGEPSAPPWAYWAYLYNVVPGRTLDAEHFSHSLGVTWSLCIEEHFYLVWPAIVYVCSPKALRRVCVALIVLPLIVRAILVARGAPGYVTTHWTICRTEALATGALVAMLLRDQRHLVSGLVKPAWIALALIPPGLVLYNAAVGSLNESESFRIVNYTIFAALFGALLLLTVMAPPGSLLVRIFSHSSLRTLGRYSYAMYLLNQPVKFTLQRYVLDPDKANPLLGSKIPAQLLFAALVIAVTLALAIGSWHLFEKHFLKLKRLFPMTEQRPARARVTSPPREAAASPIPASARTPQTSA